MMTPAAEAAAYPPLEVVVARRVRCLRCEYRKHSSCYYRMRHGTRHGHAACQQVKNCPRELEDK